MQRPQFAAAASAAAVDNISDMVAECGALPEQTCVRYLLELLDAVEQAAAAAATDRDCCLSRVSIVGKVLLRTDHGSSEAGTDHDGAAKKSLPYCPPETDSTPEKVAVWSLGVFFFCMLAGYAPFAEASARCPYFASYAKTNEMAFPHHFSWHAIRLLCRMLALSSEARLGFSDVREIACRWQQEQRASVERSMSSLFSTSSPKAAGATSATRAKRVLSCTASDAAAAALDRSAPAAKGPASAGCSAARCSKRQRLPTLQGELSFGDELGWGMGWGEGWGVYESGGDEGGVAIPVLNSPRSEWPRRRDLCPQLPSCGAPSAGRTALRHLGWEGLSHPVPLLFEALRAAVGRIGLPAITNPDLWALSIRLDTGSLSTSPTSNSATLAPAPAPIGAPIGAPIVVEAWVAVGTAQRHAICVKRVSGDTFVFHRFYRRLREEMAPLNGWKEGAYRGQVVPGVAPNMAPKWLVKLRELLLVLQEGSTLMARPPASPRSAVLLATPPEAPLTAPLTAAAVRVSSVSTRTAA